MPLFLTSLAIIVSLFVSKIKIKKIRLAVIKNGDTFTYRLLILFILIFISWTVVSGAINHISFNLDKIYELRTKMSEYLNVGFMAYFNSWSLKIFTPLVFVISLHKKNTVMIFVTLILHLYYFGITQHRIFIFSPILVYMIWIMYIKKFSLIKLVFYASFGLASGLVATFLFGWEDFSAIVIRRPFFVPAAATYRWIDFFSEVEKVYWTDHFFSGLFFSNYNGLHLPFYLGESFAPGKGAGFNTGLVGAGYAQAGVSGVILYSIIIGLVLKVINGLVKQGIPIGLIAAVLAIPIRIAWSDSDIFAALLTHGILVAILLFWLIGKTRFY